MVVSTLVLCGVDDQPRALREIHRVLRPEGRLLFLEHVRSDDLKVARKQDRMNGLNRFMVCCDCNRPTLETIREAGFGDTPWDTLCQRPRASFARPSWGPRHLCAVISPGAQSDSPHQFPSKSLTRRTGVFDEGFKAPSTALG